MSRVIHKYELSKHQAKQTLSLPHGADILKVAVQYDKWVIWVDFEEGSGTELRTFYTVGTGQPLPDHRDMYYLDTIFEGVFVWHIYQLWEDA